MATPSFIADAVLESKRKALAAKQAGDIPAAKAWMQQAREWEQPTTSDAYQRLAMLYKKNGDIEGAKDALRRSKQLKIQEQEQEESPPAAAADNMAAVRQQQQQQQQQPQQQPQQQRQVPATAAAVAATPKYSDPVNQAMDDANLEELETGGGGGGGEGSISYTVDEMLDVETMADMQASGMDIPTREDYQKQAVACKKKAMLAKEHNDMAGYKTNLVQAKELLAAAEQLFSNAGAGGAVDDEDDGEDYSLLDELMGKGPSGEAADGDQDGFFQEIFGSSGTAIELDDLDDMDAGMLKDMIEAGMEVPDVEEVLHSAKQKKAMALAFKNEGNMIAAKSALEESKRLERKAQQLADLLKSIERGNVQENLDPDAMLAAMMKATDQDDKPINVNCKKDNKAAMPSEPETLKPSHQYKEEAVKCKQENRMDDALAALRMYKRALAAETAAADAIKLAEYQQKLQQEIVVAREQIRYYKFYERFVDKACGGEQLQVWSTYLNRCAAVLEKMKNDSDAPVPAMDHRSATVVAKLIVTGQDLNFVGSASTDPRIEVALLEAFDIAENKNFRKYVESLKSNEEFSLSSAAIQLKGVVQLPPSADLPEEDVAFMVDANDCQGASFQINHSIFVYAERGTSRFAKLLRRRLARRRVTVDVLLVPAKKKSFWSNSGKSDPVLLGTAVLELRHLLERRSVAGDLPLLDVTRRHEIGGKLRMAVCTNQPFEEMPSPETAATGVSSATVALRPYPLLVLE